MRGLRRVVSVVTWPVLIGGAVVYYFGVAARDPARLPIALGLGVLVGTTILLLLESVIPFRDDWAKRGDPAIGSDLLHSIAAFGAARIAGIVLPLAALAAVDRTEVAGLLGWWPSDLPYAAQVLLLVFLADGIEYWLHRSTHVVPWLWSLHVVHHMPDRLHVLKAGRHHAAYFFIRYFVVLAPFALLGAPPSVVIWYPIAIQIFGPITHANVDARVPQWLNRVVLTPGVHRLHHALDLRQGNSNFALIFPIWDVLFGTFADPAKERLQATGVPTTFSPSGFLADLARPFVQADFSRTRAGELEARAAQLSVPADGPRPAGSDRG